MADGSGQGTARDGSTQQPNMPGAPSWGGGSVPDTFDPKTFGTKLFSDLDKTYGQGPKVNPYPDYVPYGGQTLDFINQGMGNAGNVGKELGGFAYGDVGSQNPFYLSGPDYTKGIVGDVAKGKYLGNGNPYLNKQIAMTRDDVSNDVNSTFASNGRFGSDIHASGLAEGLGNAENTARFNQYNTDYGNMMQALGLQTGQAADRRGQFDTEYNRKLGAMDRIGGATDRGLLYSGLLDSKAKEKRLSDQSRWDATNNADYNHLAKYLGLLRGGDSANETNKPLSLWDILGGVGSFVGDIL